MGTPTTSTTSAEKHGGGDNGDRGPCRLRLRRLSQVAAGTVLPSPDGGAGVVLNRHNPFNVFRERIVVAMVGLPARGKSYVSKAIVRYLNFLGCPARLFNAGNSRRAQGLAGTDAAFFDPKNAEGKAFRERAAMECLEELLEWTRRPEGGCSLGILDATNTTVERRKKIIDRIRDGGDPTVRLLFVESVADDPDLLETNYKMKLSNDDYKGVDPEKALADFRERVRKYEAAYETIGDDEAEREGMAYIRMVNAGRKLESRMIDGHVMRKIQRLLGSIHLWPRTIWLVLVGESENDKRGIFGGDTDLTEDGARYARAVGGMIAERARAMATSEFISDQLGADVTMLYTGTNKRYVQSADMIMAEASKSEEKRKYQALTLGHLNDLHGGIMDGMSNDERLEKFPEECAARKMDMLNYRYPGIGGESYQDLIARGNELTCLLEQSRGNSIAVCDRALFKVMLGYFTGKSIHEIPTLQVEGGVLELARTSSGFETVLHRVPEGKATSSAGRYPN